MRMRVMVAVMFLAPPLAAKDAPAFDPATAFGSRPSVLHLSLSPDGKSLAYVAPNQGMGSFLYTVSSFIGDGATMRAGSPAQNADKIKVPVLLFHGALDRNVAIGESQHMARSLAAAGVKHELVTWDDLDHQLDDSGARAELLRKSDAFLRQALSL
jgi:alpha-beta hydrolase superfamily lysophospholipase